MVPEIVATAPNQGTNMAIVSTVVNTIKQKNALSMAKSATGVTNSITFIICAAVVTNAPSSDPMPKSKSHDQLQNHVRKGKGHNFHNIQESG